jgi:hypothetical protein
MYLALVAGLIGGAAEIAWVALYSSLSGTNGLGVAREIVASVLPAAAALSSAPLLGIAIHMALSAALGLVLAQALVGYLVPRLGIGALVPSALGALACVWAFNFFVVLPVLNPAFLALMPLAATLASKLLFGLAMAWTLRPVAVKNFTMTRDNARHFLG